MSMTWDDMRKFVWSYGWRPVKYKEHGRVVLAWEHKETGRFCQDLEGAYRCEHYRQEVK